MRFHKFKIMFRASDVESNPTKSGPFVLRVENIPENMTGVSFKLMLKRMPLKDLTDVQMQNKGESYKSFCPGNERIVLGAIHKLCNAIA